MESGWELLWKVLMCIVVLHKCQDRRSCKLMASAAQFASDPCPGTSKYLEVAYKCRPNEFRSRITCEGDELTLRCKKSQRIAIYSATFGRSRRGNLECPSETSAETECRSSCSMDVVLKQCHGKRHCTMAASSASFGDPCAPGVRKYLSVIYACVPKRILKEIKANNGEPYPNTFCNRNRDKSRDGGSPETETPSDGIPPTRRGDRRRPQTTERPTVIIKPSPGSTQGVSTVHEDEVPSVTEQTPAVRAPENQSDEAIAEVETTVPCATPDGKTSAVGDNYVGFLTDWIYTVSFIQDNLEKFILYLILGLFLGLILLLLTIIVRMSQTRRRKKRKAKLTITEPAPNSSGQTEDLELLSDSDRTDGIEILSINHNNRPPPFRTDTGSRSMASSYYS